MGTLDNTRKYEKKEKKEMETLRRDLEPIKTNWNQTTVKYTIEDKTFGVEINNILETKISEIKEI